MNTAGRDGAGRGRRPRAGEGAPRSRGAGRPRSASGGSGRASRSLGNTPAPARPQRPAVAPPEVDVHDPDGVRLQKLLAGAGVGSRRACEDLITNGRVEVDGQIVTELGVRVDPVGSVVRVDGERIVLDPGRVYLALNKPLGVVSTMSDDRGRPCVGDLVQGRTERLFHVGRLDTDTDGLLLLTNDGELANRLQHPSYGVPKTYIATVPGPVARDVGRTLRAGVDLADGRVAVDGFRLIDSLPGRAIVEVVLHEGRKHVVRRLLEAVGHPVETLTRTNVGPVRIGDLKPGKTRPLNGKEIAELYRAAGL
ncbi:MAG: rRNA pseudouridine synthase [Austwickia sp.]|nr:rRNA pseudouridine synthase [Austwickia sp.]MCO5309989.1 rRNA pseudouridine synthase [Austwickia sp.]